MTNTVAGPELSIRLAEIAAHLGAFPHAGLVADPERHKQTTRLHKVACPDCGYTARITAKWIAAGLPICPCGSMMRLNALAGQGSMPTASPNILGAPMR